MTTLGLKNVNMLSKEQYDGVTVPANDELYAISGSGFGFPSGNYDVLSLGATGTKYTAPANGYIYLAKASSASSQYIKLFCETRGYSTSVYSSASGQTLRQMLLVEKGYVFQVDYTAAGNTIAFKFLYAEGE